MTRNEAREALVQGKTVRHEYYTDGEWLKFNGITLFTEDGYHKGDFTGEFWTKYQVWNDGWSIVE